MSCLDGVRHEHVLHERGGEGAHLMGSEAEVEECGREPDAHVRFGPAGSAYAIFAAVFISRQIGSIGATPSHDTRPEGDQALIALAERRAEAPDETMLVEVRVTTARLAPTSAPLAERRPELEQ